MYVYTYIANSCSGKRSRCAFQRHCVYCASIGIYSIYSGSARSLCSSLLFPFSAPVRLGRSRATAHASRGIRRCRRGRRRRRSEYEYTKNIIRWMPGSKRVSKCLLMLAAATARLFLSLSSPARARAYIRRNIPAAAVSLFLFTEIGLHRRGGITIFATECVRVCKCVCV